MCCNYETYTQKTKPKLPKSCLRCEEFKSYPPPPGCSPTPHLQLMRGCLVTAQISPFSAHQCQIEKYGDRILEEVDGFTPQLAEGSPQQASTPRTVPCPQLGDPVYSRGLLVPSACHLPSEMQTALRGDLLQECRENKNAVQDEDYVELGDFWLQTLQVSNTSSQTRSE